MREIGFAKKLWPEIQHVQTNCLKFIIDELKLSVVAGDILLLDQKWYVTHTGLLRLARRNRCLGIDVRSVPKLCDPTAHRWTMKATVYTSRTCRGFVGYGDADPSNVSQQVRGAEMRVAETRAVNRALRKAYGIGICSVEELGTFSGPLPPAGQVRANSSEPDNRNGHDRPLRDRLCQLVRQHRLDAVLVKAYAADFCEVDELRKATRQQVGKFIQHLAEYANNDHEGLLCQLNSYKGESDGSSLVQIAPAPPEETGREAGAA
jgi:hypothetical protein